MQYDTVVIGAGLAGLHCARRLAGKGLRVVLLDRKESLSAPVHTTGIFVRKTWEDFPLPEEQLGRPIREVVLYSPRRRPLALHAQRDEFRIGRMSWLYLWLLEECVRAGVTWLPGTRLVSIGEDDVTVEHHGKVDKLRARYVIGADGARSHVAQQLGLDRNEELLVGLEDVVPSLTHKPALHCYLDPRIAPGYIAWIADDGEEAHVGVAGYRERFDPARALAAFRTEVGAGRSIERRGGLIPVGGMLRRIANERGLLIGDAAGAVSPLTAGGLDGAIRLSEFASDVIAAHLDGGGKQVLRQYSGDRFRARFMTRRWMRKTIRFVESRWTMELACAMLRLPTIRPLAEHVFFARGSFPDARLVLNPA